ncbi:hypothetical protein [Thauera butanivorans]|nr:hypothetical protein [Thauera butanivorans]
MPRLAGKQLGRQAIESAVPGSHVRILPAIAAQYDGFLYFE